MSIIYLLLRFLSDFGVKFGYDKVIFLVLVDLDIIALNAIHQIFRRARRKW